MMHFAHLLYRIVISHNDLVAKKMLFFLLIYGIIACSKVQDQQIQPESVPEAIVALVGERVPGAVGVNFTPVIPRKIWMANAYHASTMHRFFVSRTQILEHYRGIAYLNNEGIQQIIQEASIGEYGFLTTPWVSEINKPGEIKYQSDFALDGERHLFTCHERKGPPGEFEIHLYPRVYNQFETTNYADLPDPIQDLLPARNFVKAIMTEEGNRVYFHLELKNGVIEIDDDLRLFYSNVDGSAQTISELDLPQRARDWLAEHPISEKLPLSSYEKYTFRGTEGYRVVFSNSVEKKYLHFDNLGKNLYHYYSLKTVL